ncbi:MAG TPA: hypothetical protein VFH89_14420 [Sphingomicrobium sp.]|nr:hypothetical protein [Sphingomicrobium sp.]
MADLFGERPITYADKEACVRRELAFRRRLYPRWVEQRKVTQEEADREIETMSAIVDDYARCSELERRPTTTRATG